MDPIEFPEQTNKLAKGQPQYRVLPVHIKTIVAHERNDAGEIIKLGYSEYTCKYQLTDLDILQILETRSVYFMQSGSIFHPIRPSIFNPFYCVQVTYRKVSDMVYDIWVPMSDGSEAIFLNTPYLEIIKTIKQKLGNVTPESIVWIERPEMGVDKDGNIIDM